MRECRYPLSKDKKPGKYVLCTHGLELSRPGCSAGAMAEASRYSRHSPTVHCLWVFIRPRTFNSTLFSVADLSTDFRTITTWGGGGFYKLQQNVLQDLQGRPSGASCQRKNS